MVDNWAFFNQKPLRVNLSGFGVENASLVSDSVEGCGVWIFFKPFETAEQLERVEVKPFEWKWCW